MMDKSLKGCFVLQRRFAYLGHELAILLKERGVNEFCGYVHLRESYEFLKQQKDIRYTSLILDEDIQKQYKNEKLDREFLKNFEAEYGTVWRFINVDRVIRHGQLVREYPHDASPYTEEEMQRIAQVFAKRLLEFLEREKPDFIFMYQPGALGSLMLYDIAKKKGIAVLVIVPTSTRDRIALSETYDRLTWVEAAFRDNLNKKPGEITTYNDAKKLIGEFRKKPVIYSTVYDSLIKHGTLRQFEFFLPRNIGNTIAYLRLLFRNWRDPELRSDYTTINPFWYIYDRVKRKLRNLRGVSDLYDEFDPGVPFVFFPLHFEPELSVLLLSPDDTDQLAIVKRLASAVPRGVYVYVKEHPQMTPFRPRRFYKELKKIPNVKLLRPELSSFKIIPASKLVATITGSAGWEATLLGKPVLTFGNVFYNALPSVAYSGSPEGLAALVQEQLAAKVDDDVLVRFVAALLEDSAECDIFTVWEKIENARERRESLKSFADLVAQKAKLLCKIS